MRRPAILLVLALAGCNDNDGFEIAEAPRVADPMLIDVTWDPSSPRPTQLADIRITIQNQGGLASRTTELEVTVVEDPCGERIVHLTRRLAVPALGAQQAVLLVTDHRFDDRSGISYGVRLRLDPDGLLDESIEGWDGESNNVYDCNDVRDQQGRVTLTAGEGTVTVTEQVAPSAGG